MKKLSVQPRFCFVYIQKFLPTVAWKFRIETENKSWLYRQFFHVLHPRFLKLDGSGINFHMAVFGYISSPRENMFNKMNTWPWLTYRYCIVASISLSCFEAHEGLFRLLIRGIFNLYVLWPFDKKLIFLLVTHVNTCDFAVNKNTTSKIIHVRN